MQIESFNEALIECVKSAGGSKVVASILWPEKPLSQAQQLLLSCLNTERAEKLNPEQALLIIKLAKEAGIHTGIEYICHTLSYTMPQPIQPEDEKAQLMREFIAAQKQMANLAKQMEIKGILKVVS